MNSFFYKDIPQVKEDWDEIGSMFKDVVVDSKTALLMEGEIAEKIYFVNQGCLRLWFNDDGKDITFQFFFEKQEVSSIESFYSNEPSIFNIEAIEDSHLTYIKKDDFQKLLYRYPELKERMSEMILNRLMNYTKLFLSRIKNSPEKRYLELITQDSQILKRVSHHYIASYLGITPVSLSRIRKRVE